MDKNSVNSKNDLPLSLDVKPLPKQIYRFEKPISKVYPVIDTDLARDNIENNITQADLQDL